MKYVFLAMIISVSLISCNEAKKEVAKDIVIEETRNEVTKDIVIEEIKKVLISGIENPKISEDKDGNIDIYGNNNEVFSISRNGIVIENIDDDGDLDAYVSLGKSYGGNAVEDFYFIILSNNGRIAILDFLPGVQRFNLTKIEDKVLYGTISNYGQDDPMCCPSIIEYKKYTVISGKVVEVQ